MQRVVWLPVQKLLARRLRVAWQPVAKLPVRQPQVLWLPEQVLVQVCPGCKD